MGPVTSSSYYLLESKLPSHCPYKTNNKMTWSFSLITVCVGVCEPRDDTECGTLEFERLTNWFYLFYYWNNHIQSSMLIFASLTRHDSGDHLLWFASLSTTIFQNLNATEMANSCLLFSLFSSLIFSQILFFSGNHCVLVTLPPVLGWDHWNELILISDYR